MENSSDIKKLLEERDRISLANMLGERPDLTRLREISRGFPEINSDGTDEELWNSTLEYAGSSGGGASDRPPVKNVVFDIGGVLVYVRKTDFFTDRGFSEETALRIRKAYVKDWPELDRGVIPYWDVVEMMTKRDPEIKEEIKKVFSDMNGFVRMFDYTIPWIKELKARGLNVFYLSNWPEKLRSDCADALEFIPLTDGGVFSFEEKLIKPDPEIYRRLMTRYGIRAEESVFIDDLPGNVRAAEELGFGGIVFTGRDDAAEKLEKLLK